MNSSTSSLAPIARRLEGKVAIITGGASGIGESAARLFLRHGAKVVVADVQDAVGKSLCEELTNNVNNTDINIQYVHCDVTSEDDVSNAVDFAVAEYGQLDIMFNNAGISGDVDPTVAGSTGENFKRVFGVNVYGAFLGAKHAARVMVPAARGGAILFTASVASASCGESPHAYTASKHAVVGLMKSLCVELGRHGIRVNAVSPCPVATPLLTSAMGMDAATAEAAVCAAAVLKGVVPRADDVAEAALYLVSDEAKVVSGVNLMVDGGYSTTNPSFGLVLKNIFSQNQFD